MNTTEENTEEYKGDFIFTEADVPKWIPPNIWERHKDALQKGKLPLDGGMDGEYDDYDDFYFKKIPNILHHIYYTVAGWEKFGESLPSRLPDGIYFNDGNYLQDKLSERDEIADIFIEKNGKEVDFSNHIYQFGRLDLSETNLLRINLIHAHLEGVNLYDSHLEGANLSEAHLEGANLTLAHLEKANLTAACLEAANLTGAYLEGATLFGANLEGTNLYNSYLEGADLTRANLEGAKLTRANLKGANLYFTKFDTSSIELIQIKSAIIINRDINIGPNFFLNFNLIKSSSEYVKELRRYKSWWHAPSRPFWRNKVFGGWRQLDFQEINKEGKVVPNKTVFEGVNGIFLQENESVSFYQNRPEADSMKGESLQVVMDNLKRARWQLGFSFLMLGFAFAILYLFKLTDTTKISIFGIELTSQLFIEVAWVWPLVSALMYLLIGQHMETALIGTRQLQKRVDVAQVAGFPWPLSQHNRPPIFSRNYSKIKLLDKIQLWLSWGLKAITRRFFEFHPILLCLFLYLNESLTKINHILLLSEFMLLLFLCRWIWRLSQSFQKPILFDPEVEKQNKDAADALVQKTKDAYDAQITIAKELESFREILANQQPTKVPRSRPPSRRSRRQR
jgi:hypothetical protein